jgi:hypothetical protein
MRPSGRNASGRDAGSSVITAVDGVGDAAEVDDDADDDDDDDRDLPGSACLSGADGAVAVDTGMASLVFIV